jgi:nucleobase:cation symporter-1, NCS1 family
MKGILERVDVLPEWGIEPVPTERRVLSGVDLGILWGDLGIGILVLVTGALLVPGLGFGTAVVAIVLGSVIGCSLLAVAGAAGASTGVPTMVLFRPVLGLRGSWFPTTLNALQLVGWTAVELWAMSYVADLVSREFFGFSARPMWLIVAAVICTGLALWGPVGVARVWLRRFGAWVIVGICAVVTVLVLTSEGIWDRLSAPGTGGWPTFGAALDLVIAMPVSWLPLVADYNRFSTRTRGAVFGTFWGYLFANIWLYCLGAMLVLARGGSPDPLGIAGAILAVGGGSLAGLLLLVGLLAGETDEAFADIYSGAVSLQNIWPRASQRVFTVAIAAVATLLAAWLTMERYESFLFLIGSVFVPMFGVLTADHFFNRRGAVIMSDLYTKEGRYWYTAGVRWRVLVPWLAGFVVYHWIVPTGPAWWTDAVTSVIGQPLGERWGWLAASIPAFAVAFLLALHGPRRRRRLSSEHPTARSPRRVEV